MINSQIRIVIAEDSAIQAEKLRRALAGEGYSVVVAKNGAEGLVKARELKPELVISDINMPEMTGFELCKHIKSDAALISTPVILLTSLSDPTDVISGLECGADNFIVKPYDEGHLLSKIKDILSNRELQEPSLPQKAVEIRFAGRKYSITAEKKQILGLLISTYENAVQKNAELIKVQEKLESLNEDLELKVREAEEAKNQADAATRAKSNFLANMSHELRTPLNSINGFSEVLADETFGPLNEKQKKYVNNISISGKHLLLLINQILDTAKVEAGKMKIDLTSLSMKNILKEISMLVADIVGKKKVQMSLEIDDDLPNIMADELKVKEILYNLLSNAAKFTPEGGEIGIRAKKVSPEIEIVVWDTGIGIAPENMEKIFEGFFRVDTPYSRVTEGTGLGLPLSRKLVELHGGKLSAESKGLGKGTLVRFTLPITSGNVV